METKSGVRIRSMRVCPWPQLRTPTSSARPLIRVAQTNANTAEKSSGLRDLVKNQTCAISPSKLPNRRRISPAMNAEDIAIADQLLEAVDRDDREAVYGLFSDDIEYVTDRRTLRGIDELGEAQLGQAEGRTRRRVRKGRMGGLGRQPHAGLPNGRRWKENGEIADPEPHRPPHS